MRKKISIKTILFSFRLVCATFFIAMIALSPALGLAAPTCNNFEPAIFKITNNGGSSNFNLGDTIQTALNLKTKNMLDGGSGPSDIVLVMDRSSSMGWDEVNGRAYPADDPSAKITAAKQALYATVNAVAATNTRTRIALITFGGRSATLDQPFTTDYNAVKVAINKMKVSGTTSVGGGLITAGGVLAGPYTLSTKRFVILASDGRQNLFPSISDGIGTIPPDVTVYTVGIGDDSLETDMMAISKNSGAKNGLYFYANVSNLVQTFQAIISQIIGHFLLENFSLEFTRKDTLFTLMTGTNPVFSAYDTTNSVIKWDNLGSMTNNLQKDIQLTYRAERVGTGILLNTPMLRASYSIGETSCVDAIPVNVLSVVIFNNPKSPCNENEWVDTENYKVRCDTLTIDQVNSCGNHRKVKGTIHCPECSDYVDNDKDGKIDYPLDPGCTGPEDDREFNINFNFFEF